jgi:hypothetical protein
VRYPEWAWLIRAAQAVGAGGDRRPFSGSERAAAQPFLDFMAREISTAAMPKGESATY